MKYENSSTYILNILINSSVAKSKLDSSLLFCNWKPSYTKIKDNFLNKITSNK